MMSASNMKEEICLRLKKGKIERNDTYKMSVLKVIISNQVSLSINYLKTGSQYYPKIHSLNRGWFSGNMCPRPLGPKEIDGLLVPPGKAYTLLTDHLITG